MNRDQSNDVSMMRTLSAHLQNHPEVLAGITFLETLRVELNAGIEIIDEEAAKKSGGTKGATADKAGARQAAIALAVPIGAAATAHANRAGNATLREKTDFSKSALEGAREESCLTTLEELLKAAQSVAADLVARGITAAHLTALATAVAKFRLRLSAPQLARTEIGEAVEALAQQIGATKKMLREEMDPTAEAAGLTFPAFLTGYRIARTVIDRTGGQSPGPDPVPA